jgi:hypothetical protein
MANGNFQTNAANNPFTTQVPWINNAATQAGGFFPNNGWSAPAPGGFASLSGVYPPTPGNFPTINDSLMPQLANRPAAIRSQAAGNDSPDTATNGQWHDSSSESDFNDPYLQEMIRQYSQKGRAARQQMGEG